MYGHYFRTLKLYLNIILNTIKFQIPINKINYITFNLLFNTCSTVSRCIVHYWFSNLFLCCHHIHYLLLKWLKWCHCVFFIIILYDFYTIVKERTSLEWGWKLRCIVCHYKDLQQWYLWLQFCNLCFFCILVCFKL